MIGILVLDSVKPCTTWIVFTGSVLLSIVFARSVLHKDCHCEISFRNAKIESVKQITTSENSMFKISLNVRFSIRILRKTKEFRYNDSEYSNLYFFKSHKFRHA